MLKDRGNKGSWKGGAQVSNSPTFYVQLLWAQISKAQNWQSSHQYFFALLGSARVKAARKTLMKLTLESTIEEEIVWKHLHHQRPWHPWDLWKLWRRRRRRSVRNWLWWERADRRKCPNFTLGFAEDGPEVCRDDGSVNWSYRKWKNLITVPAVSYYLSSVGLTKYANIL